MERSGVEVIGGAEKDGKWASGGARGYSVEQSSGSACSELAWPTALCCASAEASRGAVVRSSGGSASGKWEGRCGGAWSRAERSASCGVCAARREEGRRRGEGGRKRKEEKEKGNKEKKKRKERWGERELSALFAAAEVAATTAGLVEHARQSVGRQRCVALAGSDAHAERGKETKRRDGNWYGCRDGGSSGKILGD